MYGFIDRMIFQASAFVVAYFRRLRSSRLKRKNRPSSYFLHWVSIRLLEDHVLINVLG
jgi:hypothetical protein